jgi:aspartate aminotransferase-like enzyme
MEALEHTLDQLDDEGLANRLARHARARDALRAGLARAAVSPLAGTAESANTLATAVLTPESLDIHEILADVRQRGGNWVFGGDSPKGRYIRLSHFGRQARLGHILTQLVVLLDALAALGLQTDPPASAGRVAETWFKARW